MFKKNTTKENTVEGELVEKLSEAPKDNAIIIEDAEQHAVEINEILMLMGQAQAFDVVEKIGNVSTLRILQRIKETKSYKGLQLKDSSGKLETVSDFDQICRLTVGKTGRHVSEDIKNLETFGEEAFQAMGAIGLGYRNIRKLRALPDDERVQVTEQALKAENKDQVRQIIDNIVLENHALKNELKDQERHAAKQETALEKAERELEDWREKNKITGELKPLDEFVETTRINSCEWAERAIDAISRFEQVIDMLDNAQGHGLNPDVPADQTLFGMSASIVGYNVDGILARATEVSQRLKEVAGDVVNYEPGETAKLSTAEIARIESTRSTMMIAHDAQEKINHNKVADKLSKRGRRKVVK